MSTPKTLAVVAALAAASAVTSPAARAHDVPPAEVARLVAERKAANPGQVVSLGSLRDLLEAYKPTAQVPPTNGVVAPAADKATRG
ncbi:MAG: hypothetical protein EBZ69_02245 [Alphaproteobacteria bacterium]|nr:hypothetical protein [Alphaproteobacteria bacterium]NDC55623.1 hypothetical protein [Alphaproteobacteria bacterium]